MSHAPEEGHHRHDHEGRGIDRYRGRDRLEQSPDRRSEHAADEHARPEDAARTAGADRERRGEDLRERQHEDHPQWDGEQCLTVEPGLHEAVPGAQHARDDQPDTADDEAGDRRFRPAWWRPGAEPVSEAIEVADVEQPDEPAGDADQGVPGKLCRVAEGERGLDPEDRGEAFHGAEDRIGDDRGDERRDERVRLDVVAVQELGTEHGATERCPEDRPDAGRHAHGDRDPRVAGVEVEDPPEEGPEPGADLGGRSLATAGAARSDRDRGGHHLHQRDAPADPARVVVVRSDPRIGPVAFGLRREAVDNEP